MVRSVSMLFSDRFRSLEAARVISATSSLVSSPDVKKIWWKASPFLGLFLMSTRNSSLSLSLIFYLIDFNSGPKQETAMRIFCFVLIEASAVVTQIKGLSVWSHFLWVFFSRLENVANKYWQYNFLNLSADLKNSNYFRFWTTSLSSWYIFLSWVSELKVLCKNTKN